MKKEVGEVREDNKQEFKNLDQRMEVIKISMNNKVQNLNRE